jgi:two-component system, sensor histidine kinase YesM
VILMPLKNDLKTKIVTPLIAMLFAFTLILLIVIRLVSKISIENFIYQDIYSRQQEMYSGLTMVLDEVNLLYSRMVLHDDFSEMLQNEALEADDKKQIYQEIIGQVGVNHELFGDILLLFDDELYRLNQDEQVLPKDSFYNTVKNSDQLIEYGGVIEGNTGSQYVIIGKQINNFPLDTVSGTLFFYINETALRNFYNNISTDLGYSFILDNQSEIVSNTKGSFIGATIFDHSLFEFEQLPNFEEQELNGERSIIIVNQNEQFNQLYSFDWKIVSIISYETLFKDVLRLHHYNLILAVIMAVLAAIASFRITKSINKPMNKIMQSLRYFSKSGKKLRLQGDPAYEELYELEKTYDDMIERITHLIAKNQEEMEKQRILELDALQLQINPHFLYNTLDAIAWMAKLKKQPEIEKLVLALAKFFRISLHKGDKFIKVKEEIQLIRNFIEIELIRFPNKFTIDYQVDEDVENEETLKLILQPIVENAIKHGISQLEYIGHIHIHVYRGVNPNYILFEVTDNGVGFKNPDEILSDDQHHLSGYGLKNVDDRIKLEYGNECGVTIHANPTGGARIVLIIKSRNNKEKEPNS